MVAKRSQRGKTIDTTGSGQVDPDPFHLSVPDFQFQDQKLQDLAILTKSFIEKGLGVGTDSNDRYLRVKDLVSIGIIRGIDGKLFTGDKIAPPAAQQISLGPFQDVGSIHLMPRSFQVSEVILSCDTAPTGAACEMDMFIGGSSILSTNITIEDGENSSLDAAVQPVVSDPDHAQGDVITLTTITLSGAALFQFWLLGIYT
jgi:hypothetical protein